MKRNLKKILLNLTGVSFCLASCSMSASKITAFQCDTFFEYLDYEEGKIANELKKKVDKLENIFDPYKEGTELYKLNQERTLTVSDDLLSCLKTAVEVQEETNGYFNPLMGKLSKDWMTFIDEKRDTPLNDEEISAHLEEINSSSISFEGNKVTINGTADIDLSGICKGYLIDSLYEYVKDKTDNYLVSAGASSVLLGSKPGNEDFNVSVRHGLHYFMAKDITVSTSGMDEQHREYVNHEYYSHLINPKTGSALAGKTHEAVLVGRNGTKGDALATAFIFMNEEEREDIAKKENIKYAIYDSEQGVCSLSFVSEGFELLSGDTNK